MKKKTKFITVVSLVLVTACSLVVGGMFSKTAPFSPKQSGQKLMGNMFAKPTGDDKNDAKITEELLADSAQTADILRDARDQSSLTPPDVQINDENRLSITFSPYYLVNRVDDLLNGTGIKDVYTEGHWPNIIAYSDAYQKFINDRLNDSIQHDQESSKADSPKPISHDLIIDTGLFGSTYSVVGVTSSGRNADHIDVPAGISRICSQAFSNCTNLKTITLPQSINQIDEKAFSGCTSLRAVTLPRQIRSLSDGIFSDCTSLKSLVIPIGVTSIGTNAFNNCSNLTTMFVNGDLNEVGTNSFDGCSSLKHVYVFADDVKAHLKKKSGLSDDQIINVNNFKVELNSVGSRLYFSTDQKIYVDFPKITFSAIQPDLYGIDFAPQTFSFPYFHGFFDTNVLELVINNPQIFYLINKSRIFNVESKVPMLVKSPTLQFVFTKVFSGLIRNLNQLPVQYQFLIEAKEKLHGQSQTNLDSIIKAITNYQVSCEAAADVIADINTSQTVKEKKEYNIGENLADWYNNANKELGFSLKNVDIKDWHYFIELASLRFSQNLSSDVIYNGESGSKNVTVWDGVNYKFKGITNDGLQTNEAETQDQARMKISYPSNKDINNSFFTPTTDSAKTMIQKLGDKFVFEIISSPIKDNPPTISYTYPYNQNPCGYAMSDFSLSQANDDPKKYNVTFKLTATKSQPEIGFPPKDSLSLSFTLNEEKSKPDQTTVKVSFDLSGVQNASDHDWIKNELFNCKPQAAAFDIIQKEFKTQLLEKLSEEIKREKSWTNCCFNALEDKLQILGHDSSVIHPELSCNFSNHACLDLTELPNQIIVPCFADSSRSPQEFKADLLYQINKNINVVFSKNDAKKADIQIAESDYTVSGIDDLNSASLLTQITIKPVVDAPNFILNGQKNAGLLVEQYRVVHPGELRYYSISADVSLDDFINCQNQHKSAVELAQTWLMGFDLSTIDKVQLVKVDSEHFEVHVTLKNHYVFRKERDQNVWISSPLKYGSTFLQKKAPNNTTKRWTKPLGLGLGIGTPLVILGAVGIWFVVSYWRTKKQVEEE